MSMRTYIRQRSQLASKVANLDCHTGNIRGDKVAICGELSGCAHNVPRASHHGQFLRVPIGRRIIARCQEVRQAGGRNKHSAYRRAVAVDGLLAAWLSTSQATR